MSTAHNAAKKGEIARKVLMPGDPLRAKFIAETYLEDVRCFNSIRGMLGYTGTYKGEPVSVMGSGMGMPSIGIYSHELYHVYDVDTILRVGSAGAFGDDINLRDIVIGQAACTNSSYADQFRIPGHYTPIADFGLIRRAVEIAEAKGSEVKVGNILSSDTFYHDDPNFNDHWRDMGVLCVEMEAAALYLNAARAGKKALAILTISDHLYKPEQLTAEERQIGFGEMIEIALEI